MITQSFADPHTARKSRISMRQLLAALVFAVFSVAALAVAGAAVAAEAGKTEATTTEMTPGAAAPAEATTATEAAPAEAGAAAAAAPDASAYRVNPGDLLAISVWKEEGLDRQVLVLPDGKLQFPLVGEITASGKSIDQIQNEVTERIKKYIPDAVVTVSVINAVGNKAYVVGDVARPGEIQLVRPMTVLQAIGMAGGLTPYASETRIRIIRQQADGKQTVIPFDFEEVKAGRELDSNIILQSGDTIVVPGSSLF
jgi:polysaccharide export outer membrane protein